MFPGEKDLFLAAKELLSQLKHAIMPLESIATSVSGHISEAASGNLMGFPSLDSSTN